ncbi:MAG: hypothetical protein ABMB14_23315 [Myxococcota bacterium]
MIGPWLAAGSTVARAADPADTIAGEAAAAAVRPDDGRPDDVRPGDALPPVFSGFVLFQAKATVDDLASTNPLLDGQVVGRLGGTNGVVVDPTVRSAYAEQRVSPFVTFAPRVLDGKGSLTAAFEVDFAFGDQAYGVGGNVGGGFGADQVNLQTRRLHADWFPSGEHHDLHVILGLQFVADSVTDPTRTTPDGLLRSGGGLALFGSEAAGLSAFGRWRDDWGTRLRYRIGSYTLVEQGLSLPDDVWLTMADVEVRPAQATGIGAHLWYLQDRSHAGGALALGPTGSLWELQGGPSLDPYDGYPPPANAPVDADLVWAGLDASFNAGLDRGPVGVRGVVLGNFGKIYAPIVHDDGVAGATATAEARLRWARGDGSVLRVTGLFATADDADPQRYTGVVTGNAYGVVGAPMPTTGGSLLFPDPGAIDRMVAVVSDLSNQGLGLVALSAGAGWDPIPDRVTLAAGTAVAATAAGTPVGTELNGRIAARPLVGCTVAARAAVVSPGPAAPLGGTPWTISLGVDWLLF